MKNTSKHKTSSSFFFFVSEHDFTVMENKEGKKATAGEFLTLSFT